MEGRASVRQVLLVALGVCLAVLVCAVVYRIRAAFVPFAAGFVVAYILDPLLDRLEARGWSRAKAVWTVTCGLLAVLAVGLILLVPRVVGEATDVWNNQGLYLERAQTAYEGARTKTTEWLKHYMPGVEASAYVDSQLTAAREWLDAHKGDIARWFGGRLAQAGGMLILILLGTLIAFHFMMIIDPLRTGIQAMMAPEDSQQVDAVVLKVNRMLASYVRGLAAVSLIMGVGTAIGLSIVGAVFGTRYALIIGLLAGLTYAVPWLGQLASVTVALFLGFVTAAHHPLAAGLLSGGVVVLMNQISDQLILPRIVGKSVGLHPLAVMFAMLAGFELWGLVGLIVAVPLAASVRIIAQRWIPILPEDQEEEIPHLPRFDFVALGKQMRGGVERLFDVVGHHSTTKEPPAEKPANDEPGDT